MSDDTGKQIRVDVFDGDAVTHLGQGTYVGDVVVYFFRRPDGHLLFNSNAEERPSDQQIKMVEELGGSLIEMPDNPKIVLDDGRVVYGCQVWWNPIEEAHNDE